MSEEQTLKASIYREAKMFARLGSRGARRAQKENRRRGIPNAYSLRGRLYFELPSGKTTTEDPFNEVDSSSSTEIES